MYEIVVLPQAMEDLSRLDKGTARRIFGRLDWLAENIEDVTPLPLSNKSQMGTVVQREGMLGMR